MFHLGSSGEIALSNYDNDYAALWKVESNCDKTHVFSIIFDTEANTDFLSIAGAMFSGFLSFDLIVSNTFFVGFSAGSGEIKKPGFNLFWECHHKVFDLQCCPDIKASGFSNIEFDGIYKFAGNFINGRHFYVEESQVYGIWFNGNDGAWVLGYMINLAEGYGSGWAFNYQDTVCPSSNEDWIEWGNNQWTYSETALLECLV